ncbi:MAG: DUF1573 domain-containing protein [Bacteroidales bacterium]|nr:DUF1573 domain-containing protein [Bacteroidales bacterium]
MKRWFILSALIALLSIYVKADPQLTWIERVHDFGAFDEALGSVECTFKAVNTGDEPVTVNRASANCGCTTPRYTRKPIYPGDTLTVSVAYKASGRPGPFTKHVNVYTNASKKASVLTIKGTVIGTSNSLKGRYPVSLGDMRLAATVIPFGEVTYGTTASATLRGYNASSDTIHPAVKTYKGINVTVRPEAVPPGEQFVFSATLNTSKVDDWGIVSDSIYVAPSPSGPFTAISTVAIVQEDFSKLTSEEREKAPRLKVEPMMADFERLGSDEKPTMTLTLVNNGQTPLIIRKIYTPDAAVAIKLKKTKIAPGKTAELKVTAYGDRLPAGTPLNARITLITNDPKQPNTTIRVVAQH